MIDSPVRILVVDENEECFREVEECLSRASHEFIVEWAPGYEAGCASLAQSQYDVCLIDVGLAGESGDEAPGRPPLLPNAIPVILLARADDDDLDTRAFQAGAVDYLVRGAFDGARLERAVRYAVDRQRLVRALDRERYLLQTLMEYLPEYIYFKDTESRFMRVSRTLAHRMGLEHPSEAVGCTDLDFFPLEYAERAAADERELMQTQRPLIGKEEQPRWPDGTVSWVSSHKAPLRDRGQTVGTFGISHDITEQKRVAEELRVARDAAEAANRAKSEFLANMSHEIRTPLNAVLGLTDLLLQTPLGNAQREYAQLVQESGEALLALVNDVLDFAKIEAGRLELHHSVFDARATLADTLKPLALRAASKGLDLTLHCAPDVPRAVHGDRARLQQVVLNLVGNAVKFTEQGKIEVDVGCLSRSADGVLLRVDVSDTGIGIPAEKTSAIFRAFEQVDPSRTRRYGGAGLGLAIASHLIQLQGGEIRVASEEGRGSCFSFTIPLQVPGDQREIAVWPDVIHEARVLVVDTNPTNRQILQEMLSEWGLRPTSARRSDEALQSLYEAVDVGDPFRVVVSDMHPPDVDGTSLADVISQDAQLRQTSVILLASGSDPHQLQRCEKPGVTAVLIKPAKQSELFDAIVASLVPRTDRLDERDGAHAAPRTGPLRVLVAEDSLVNQRLVVGLLERHGHQVKVANNGLEAVAAFRSQPFDLILMDVQMPHLDGLQAAAAIRKLEVERDQRIPIVAITAHALRGDREQCLEAGMDEYLPKPIRAATFYETINNIVNQSRPGTGSPGTGRRHAGAELALDTWGQEASEHRQRTGVVNWSTALATVEGDKQLLAEVADAFVGDAPRLLHLVATAIESANFETLKVAAHTLKGTMRHFGSEPGAAVAERLEVLSDRRTLESAAELHSELTSHVHALCAVLREYVQSV